MEEETSSDEDDLLLWEQIAVDDDTAFNLFVTEWQRNRVDPGVKCRCSNPFVSSPSSDAIP